MNLDQFRNMFSGEVACRRYLERVIWPTGVFALTVAVLSHGSYQAALPDQDFTSAAVARGSSP